MNFVANVFVITIILCLVNSEEFHLGDTSSLYDSNDKGVCQFLINCPSGNKNLKRIPIVLAPKCGYDWRKKITKCRLPSPNYNHIKKTEGFNSGLSKREQKCLEYSRIINKTKEVDLKNSICTLDSTPNVADRSPAIPGEFPHMALLGRVSKSNPDKVEWCCGGSLISKNFVLTAAHCAYTRGSYQLKTVRLGSLYRPLESTINNDNEKYLQEFIISYVKIHPLHTILFNDIALVKLDRDVTFTDFVHPICLPSKDTSDVDRNMIATGWGKASYTAKSGSNQLFKVELQYFSRSECQLSSVQKVEQSHICAGHRTESRDTCLGDSGGPLQIKHSEMHCMYEIIGVTSHGSSGTCGVVGVPALYSNVASYVDWIESIAWGVEK